MKYQEYVDRAMAASKCADAGDFEKALDIFEALVRSDISDLDKAMMSMNVAIVCDRAGHTDDAWAWYDHGMKLEERYCRFGVAEQKAAQLANRNRPSESLALYQKLLSKPYLTEQDRQRMEANVAILKQAGA